MRIASHILALLAAATAAGVAARATAAALLPMPASMTPGTGDYRWPADGLPVSTDAADAGAMAARARLVDLVARSGGPGIGPRPDAPGGIAFVRDPAIAGAEAYRLTVTPAAVTIRASGDAGLFYGAETLWQMIVSAKDGRIPAVTIDDRPAFAWRGVMLDSCRHFQTVAYIKRLLDRMAADKLNVFHWHLADDQGWRLQIDRYPKLTEIGAWRPAIGAEAPGRYGGFYTRADVREIVAHAAALHIMVVPEIEMPGHATAMIAAYPALASTPHPPKTPSPDWGVLPNLLNTKDETFTFVENVLDEVMALFPGRYIHVGGDEAPKGQWQADPDAQARIRALGLKDENALQGWFTARIGAYLERHGRRLIGWDEILEGGVPADATVMSWRGMDGAIAAARGGHDTVLAPAPILYLDNRQSDSANEPPGRGEIVDWKRLYDFDPQPATLSPDERRHVIGVQANLWTEHLRDEAQDDRMIWPRAAILAELGWSPAAARDWTGFAGRLVPEMARWTRLGWRYDETPLEPEARVGDDGVTLAQPAGIGTLRYTLDGRAPTPSSPAYAGPLPLSGAMEVQAQSFVGDLPLGEVRRWSFDAASARTRASADLALCAADLPLRREDDAPPGGPRAIFWVDVMRPCWIWPRAKLDGIGAMSARVGSLPYNFQLGPGADDPRFRPPATPAGEMEVRRDGCDGPRIAILPLAPAAGGPGVTRIEGALSGPVGGTHDLCITFTQRSPDPLWLIDSLSLIPAGGR